MRTALAVNDVAVLRTIRECAKPGAGRPQRKSLPIRVSAFFATGQR